MRVLMICFLLFIGHVEHSYSQQRWIEYSQTGGTSAYRLVHWDSVAGVVFDRRNTSRGVRLYVLSGGQVQEVGLVPENSPSASQLRALISAQPSRWVRMWPHLNGAYVRPQSAEGFADIAKSNALSESTPIETGGGRIWVLQFPGTLSGGVVEDAERARVRQTIDTSMRP
ncbi:MAG TPA: hypothetical protein VF647_22855 [Longimicrobium sp.]|jgi:hypothetical protein